MSRAARAAPAPTPRSWRLVRSHARPPGRAGPADSCRGSPPPVTGPVTQFRIGARHQHERAVERIIRHVASLHVEVASQRRLRTRLPNRNDRTEQQRATDDAPNLDPSRDDMDDDPIRNRAQIEQITPDPAALTVRPTRQTELVPPAPVSCTTRADGEHHLELPAGSKLAQYPHERRPRGRRSPNGRTRADEFSSRRQAHGCRLGCTRRGREYESDQHAESHRKSAAANASESHVSLRSETMRHPHR